MVASADHSKQFLTEYKGISLDAQKKTLSTVETALAKPGYLPSQLKEQDAYGEQLKKKTIGVKKENNAEVS